MHLLRHVHICVLSITVFAEGELPSLDHPGNFIGDDAPMEGEELYTLTNTTGSLMYMAPEVSINIMPRRSKEALN